MNKSEFLNVLERSLNGVPYEDKKEIMYDYEEHFRIGMENGKTEDEISESLGEPKTLARLYKANYRLEMAKEQPSYTNVFRAVFAAISLGFINLIFVLGPFIGLCAIVFALFVTAFAITFSGVAIFTSAFIPWVGMHVHLGVAFVSPIALIFLGIGLTALGSLFIIGDCFMAKYFYIGTVKYLKWNISIITDKKES